MRILLLMNLLLPSIVLSSQVTFETNLKYKIHWEDNSYFEYYSEIEKSQTGINLANLIKYDNRYLDNYENIIVQHIVDNLDNRSKIGLSNIKGDTLNDKELFETLYWKWDVNIHHGDTIRWIDFEEIRDIRIHQEWRIDDENREISNRVLGISLIRYENQKEITIVYVPMNNEFNIASDLVNIESVIYIRELNNKFKWLNFPKEEITKILLNDSLQTFLPGNSSSPQNIDNEEINDLKSVFNELNLKNKDMNSALLNHSKGLCLNQYLYIDFKNNSINTKINGIAPLFPIYDISDKFKYYKTLYWVKFK